MLTRVSHHLPIITRCPVGGLDLIYITVELHEWVDLYKVRKAFKGLFFKKAYMEDICAAVAMKMRANIFTAQPFAVEVRLVGNSFWTRYEAK